MTEIYSDPWIMIPVSLFWVFVLGYAIEWIAKNIFGVVK